MPPPRASPWNSGGRMRDTIRPGTYFALWCSIVGAAMGITALSLAVTPLVLGSLTKNTLTQPRALARSIVDSSNASFRCVREGTPCHSGGDFQLESNTDDSSGISLLGVRCDAFGAWGGNLACPFHVQTSWQPTCLDANCLSYAAWLHTEVKLKSGWPSLDKLFQPGSLAAQFIPKLPLEEVKITQVLIAGQAQKKPSSGTLGKEDL